MTVTTLASANDVSTTFHHCRAALGGERGVRAGDHLRRVDARHAAVVDRALAAVAGATGDLRFDDFDRFEIAVRLLDPRWPEQDDRGRAERRRDVASAGIIADESRRAAQHGL